MSHELPPGLRPWSESLAFLTVEAALHLGPLVRRIDALVRRHDATNAERGEPDGYGGLSRRGQPEQILLSEWLLADELPLEFLRRAASGELLYVSPVARASQPRGRVAVVFDAGPDQLGAARLVQLAALVVLHRRAASRATELVVGVLGEAPDRWHGGELPEQYETWRGARRPVAPAPAELDARSAAVDDEDELWVLAGAPLAAACADEPLLVTTREAAWDAEGPTAVELRFEARSTILPLPAGPVSVRALRGRALRRAPSGDVAATGTLRCPAFASNDRRLLLRGATPEELVVVAVPTTSTGGDARPRTHRFRGPVLAAASLGRRLVALVLEGEKLVCRVVGKRLGDLEDLDVAVADVNLDEHLIESLTSTLSPLYYDRGALLCRLGEDWWCLGATDGRKRQPSLVAVAPGRQLDVPRRVDLHGERLVGQHLGGVPVTDIAAGSLRIVAGTEAVAWSLDRRWNLRGPDVKPATVSIDESCDVLGVVTAQRRDDPAILTRSRAGVLLRLHAESGVKTLTSASGRGTAHALHPVLGLLAIQCDDETIEVVALDGGEQLMVLRAT